MGSVTVFRTLATCPGLEKRETWGTRRDESRRSDQKMRRATDLCKIAPNAFPAWESNPRRRQ